MSEDSKKQLAANSDPACFHEVVWTQHVNEGGRLGRTGCLVSIMVVTSMWNSAQGIQNIALLPVSRPQSVGLVITLGYSQGTWLRTPFI